MSNANRPRLLIFVIAYSTPDVDFVLRDTRARADEHERTVNES